MNRIDILIFFILGAITFCIAFGLSSPALLINDEWITVNQVNQLATGSQLVETEGKYGRSFYGEESAYFTSRGSYLAYTYFLPILSLPAMYGIMGAGDLFRLLLLIVWFALGISALFVSLWLMDLSKNKRGINLIWILIFLFFGLFLANIYYYQPYESSFIDSPIESAAVILTNEILFSLMTPMIYFIFRNLSLPRKTALYGAIAAICCSSYLIWSSSAKDHLLVAFLLTVIFWLFSSNVRMDSAWKWFSLFSVAGLLCWARTEYGVVVAVGLMIWVLFIHPCVHKDIMHRHTSLLKSRLLPGLAGFVTGLIPLMANNMMVTGNPFIPPQYLYLTTGNGRLTSVLGTDGTVSTDILLKGLTYIQQIISFYSPDIHNIFADISGLFFAPVNNGVGILFFCPIIFPAFLYVLTHFSVFNQNYTNNVRTMLLFSGFIAVITFLGYLRVLHGSTISSGSLPDMRYFSPIYLPLGIISVLFLSPLIDKNSDRWIGYIIGIIFICVPLLAVFTLIYLSYGVSFEAYANLYLRMLLFLFLLMSGIAAWTRTLWNNQIILPLLCALLIMVPSAFQFFFVVVNALSKMNGYLYWLPVLQYLFTNVFMVLG
jgi:hypothetical protein